jgi:exosortase
MQSTIKQLRFKFIITGIIAILLGIIYFPILIWMWQRWFAADSYYGHAPLIPIVSGVLIWLKRKELAQIKLQSSKKGLILIIVGILICIFSAFTRIYFSSAYSLLIIIFGIVLYFFGKKFTYIIIFPLLFLIFIFPAPLAVIESTTLKMKLFVTQISFMIIQFLGVSAVREGSTVFMQNTSVVVGDPCSGLRSVISLSALSILYTYIVRSSYTKKAILFLSSIPIAILANLIRTTLTLLIANSYGNEIIENKYLHEGFGLMVFIIALFALLLLGKVLGCRILPKDS